MAELDGYKNPAKAHRLAEDYVQLTYKGPGTPEQYAAKYVQVYDAILKVLFPYTTLFRSLNEYDENPVPTMPQETFHMRDARGEPRRPGR